MSEYKNKTVLVTGSGGSIGSEICMQLIKLSPSKIVLFELNEFALYKIQKKIELELENLETIVIPCLGDINDELRVSKILKDYKVNVIIHAAAYKHVPLIEETRGLIDKQMLLGAKQGAVILNFAREPIVESQAILEAIDKGVIRRYLSDFPVPELVGHDGVIFTPHLGASTSEAEENCAIMAADQLVDFIETGNITNSVNFPTVSMGVRRGIRLAVVNKNVPGMLGQVTSLLASKGVNVADLINKSRNELAYNLIDIDQDLDGELLSSLRSLDNVMSVRIISD